MIAFRALLLAIFLGIVGYTTVTIANHGIGLLPIFFGDMAAMAWPGQFNFDFMCMLLLSATWVAWRNAFMPLGLVLALFAAFGGALFLSAYLLIMSFQVDGDVRKLLLGPTRA